jgi:hypothetical protein
MKKACLTRADSVWTLTYKENPDGTVSILNLDNQDNDGYMFRESLETLDEIKLEGKTATHVVINGVTYEVENKQDVYTYKQPL